MIVIDPYHPEWPAEFETIRADLARVLGARAVRIDHIGSTSVPGLGAKDVIDIQITVRA
ncbi:MAG: GrpB family protein [Anaerolineales bacterium]|nr:GrpB family protein [Anaerolineales bacterium]